MSTAAARAPRQRQVEDHHRPSLRVVATRPLVAGRLPFALLVGGILSTGLILLLLVHTMAAQDAFRLQTLERNAATLSDTRQQLALDEQLREAPDALAARARSLGMVPTGSLAFVRLHHHHKIVGVVQAVPAPAPPAPAPSVRPSPKASAQPSARASAQPATRPSTKRSHQVNAPTHRRGTRPPHG